jgi:hypothetical protein
MRTDRLSTVANQGALAVGLRKLVRGPQARARIRIREKAAQAEPPHRGRAIGKVARRTTETASARIHVEIVAQ